VRSRRSARATGSAARSPRSALSPSQSAGPKVSPVAERDQLALVLAQPSQSSIEIGANSELSIAGARRLKLDLRWLIEADGRGTARSRPVMVDNQVAGDRKQLCGDRGALLVEFTPGRQSPLKYA
jgi:hypothetical protein